MSEGADARRGFQISERSLRDSMDRQLTLQQSVLGDSSGVPRQGVGGHAFHLFWSFEVRCEPLLTTCRLGRQAEFEFLCGKAEPTTEAPLLCREGLYPDSDSIELNAARSLCCLSPINLSFSS